MKKVILTTFVAIISQLAFSQEVSDSAYWEPVMNAIIFNESRGNVNARNGIYLGPMQISPALVNGCNGILKSQGSSKSFTLNDRRSIEKSKEMFMLIMSKYNPERDIDKACRIWAGGVKYSVKGTQGFVNRIRNIMKRQANEN
ncbi:MAG: hypothetical protein Q4F34_08305 [Prevotellaceae bacterium]|nr:hypothetical protein [Prevotellaceae bacterium]